MFNPNHIFFAPIPLVVSHSQLATQPPETFNVSSDFVVNCDHPENILPETQFPSTLPTVGQHDTLTYSIVEGGTKRGRNLLVDSHGFSYSVKVDRRYKGSKITWRCTSRGKIEPCQAKVTQDGDMYVPSMHSHNHPAQPG